MILCALCEYLPNMTTSRTKLTSVQHCIQNKNQNVSIQSIYLVPFNADSVCVYIKTKGLSVPRSLVCAYKHTSVMYCFVISSKAAFVKQASIRGVIFETFPPGGTVWPATLICLSPATESLIHPERGIELLQDEDMTSSAHLMSMIGQLTCRSGILPASSPWVLTAASEQRPTTQMTSGEAPSPVA